MRHPGIATNARSFVGWSPLRRSCRAELMDAPIDDREELAANFADIRRVNRFLGGTSAVLSSLGVLIDGASFDRPLKILDLATGCADIPVAVLVWAKRRGLAVEITATDLLDDMLDLAYAATEPHPEIAVARCDARSLPYPDRSHDVVLCSLALHHFDDVDAAAVLSEMDRVGRIGFILNDLERSRVGYAAARIAARCTTRNRLTRNDAPLSVLRAFTPEELAILLRAAGVQGAAIRRRRWFRMVAVRRQGVSNVDQGR